MSTLNKKVGFRLAHERPNERAKFKYTCYFTFAPD